MLEGATWKSPPFSHYCGQCFDDRKLKIPQRRPHISAPQTNFEKSPCVALVLHVVLGILKKNLTSSKKRQTLCYMMTKTAVFAQLGTFFSVFQSQSRGFCIFWLRCTFSSGSPRMYAELGLQVGIFQNSYAGPRNVTVHNPGHPYQHFKCW